MINLFALTLAQSWRRCFIFGGFASTLFLTACGGGGGDFSYNTPAGVVVSGLEVGKNVTLQLNDDELLSVSKNGKSTFTTPLTLGSSYKVSVQQQPPGFQWCQVTNGEGKNDSVILDIPIECRAAVGRVTTYAGKYKISISSPDGVALKDATFKNLSDLIYDKEGNLYFTEPYSYVIRKVDTNGNLSIFAGTHGVQGYAEGGVGVGRLFLPRRLSFGPDGLLYVTDYRVVVTIDQTGYIRRYAGDPTPPAYRNPYYSSGVPNRSVRHLDGPKENALFYQLEGIAIDSKGNIFLADNINSVIRKIDKTSGQVSTYTGVVGLSERYTAKNGDISSATFGDLIGLVIDSKDNLYVLDKFNGVRKISTDGNVSTYLEYRNTATDLSTMAIDQYDVLYIGGLSGGPHITRVPAAGVATIVAGGLSGEFGNRDETGSLARFEIVSGIALAPDGSLMVSDGSSKTLRKVVPVSPFDSP